MIHAYDKIYLEKARTTLGRMLDFAVYDLNYKLDEIWNIFLASDICRRFEAGDASIIAGKSGVEIAYEIIPASDKHIIPKYTQNRSEEYWTGWAVAYYQWMTGLAFSRITDIIPIGEICLMYSPYHEMDIRQFCDKMNELFLSRNPENATEKN